MSPLPFYQSVTLFRPLTSGNRNSYTNIGSLRVFIQPLDDTLTSTDVSFTKKFRAYADFNADVKIEDKLQRGGEEFRVSGVSTYNFGSHSHKYLILEKLNLQ